MATRYIDRNQNLIEEHRYLSHLIRVLVRDDISSGTSGYRVFIGLDEDSLTAVGDARTADTESEALVEGLAIGQAAIRAVTS